MNELKLEEPSLKDRPDFLFQVLKNYLQLDDEAIDLGRQDEREARLRATAEARAFGAIRGALGPVRRRLFRRVLDNARLGVRNRENMRFARSRIYGLLRELINAMGGHLARAGVLDDPHDVYSLTIDEVWDFVKGTAVTTRLRELAALRKAEFDSYRSGALPRPDDRFETWGMACHRNRLHNWAADADRAGTDTAGSGGLHGTGCSPGVLTGPVRVVRSPRDDVSLNREILVAERTDPGWVPLYPAVSGLLIERGSILSHSAIVAREMGIPTIVGIPGLLAALHDGQIVTMDGSTGTVTVQEETL
jgi:pyruvate,water dikinase